ncbi:MAG: cobyrinic acid a,c-diamide synthase, partial [Deltaproteobacteria bacterium]
DNLRLLREAGAELVFFSPMTDASLPTDIHGIYLPGGYPELCVEQLASNIGIKEAIRAAVAADMPVYAECGGFIYLTEGLDALENQPEVDLVGIFPVRARMLPRRKALGYRQVEPVTGTVIGGKNSLYRGHEFHYSEINIMPDEIERCYRVSRQGVELGLEGYRVRNCLASYIHLHFGSNREIAPAFVELCRCCK